MIKKLLRFSVPVLLLIILAVPFVPQAKAQTVPEISTADLELRISLLLQIVSLMQQIQVLQAQINAMQSLPVTGGAPAPIIAPVNPAPVITPSADYPVIEASATKLDGKYEGQYRIEWLATQSRHDDNLKCTSPEIGNIGTQGQTLRRFDAGTYSFTFSCTDLVSLLIGSKTVMFTVQ